MNALAGEILDFWFLPAHDPNHHRRRVEWFRKDEKFDALIREKFGDAVESALENNAFDANDANEMLARIIVLDQFTRNIFRGTARAFAGDPLALQVALAMTNAGLDQTLLPVCRSFVYLPFEHAEDMAMQDKSVGMFAALCNIDGEEFASQLDYAHRHRQIILRFGRFPHRNAMMGRTSTNDEVEFLTQPGSSF